MKELYKKYSEIEIKIKELEKEKKQLNDEIFVYMDENKLNNVKSEFGTFFITQIKKWNYTDEFINKQKEFKNEIKELQKNEQENGKAKLEIKSFLKFTNKK